MTDKLKHVRPIRLTDERYKHCLERAKKLKMVNKKGKPVFQQYVDFALDLADKAKNSV